jgi:hypothetical protein
VIANLLINMIPALAGGITAVVTMIILRKNQQKRYNETFDEFYRRMVPEEHWPEHIKPSDPEMEEIKRLRRALEDEQQ